MDAEMMMIIFDDKMRYCDADDDDDDVRWQRLHFSFLAMLNFKYAYLCIYKRLNWMEKNCDSLR